MKIRITKSVSGMNFPYGQLSAENRQFIIDNVGSVFEANQSNMNYYVLNNGMIVHVYNAFELPEGVKTPVTKVVTKSPIKAALASLANSEMSDELVKKILISVSAMYAAGLSDGEVGVILAATAKEMG